MKYYTDDVVEIINLESFSEFFKPVVGNRYYVNRDCGNDFIEIKSLSYGWSTLNKANVTLYKRSFINKIKSLFGL